MRVEIKWLPDGRKTPVPSVYNCDIRFTHDLHCTYPAVITFPQAVRTYGDITSTTELLPDYFYIIESGYIVAEVRVSVVSLPKIKDKLPWQNANWVEVEGCPPDTCYFLDLDKINVK